MRAYTPSPTSYSSLDLNFLAPKQPLLPSKTHIDMEGVTIYLRNQTQGQMGLYAPPSAQNYQKIVYRGIDRHI